MSSSAEAKARARRMLWLLSGACLLGMSLWFTASAAAPELALRWSLSAQQVGWLTTTVQLGFVAGTALAALLNLADVVPGRAYFAVSAVAGALANLGLLAAPSFEAALACRVATGLCLAGVYPPAMKMISTWYRSGRGLAIGVVVGALALGKATPYLLRALSQGEVRGVVVTTSAAAVLAALLVGAGYREGPFPFSRRPFSWALVGAVARDRKTRLAIGGYLGHMWELYACWTWLPAFLAASAAARSPTAGSTRPGLVELLAFGAIAAGALGCVWGGWAADRIGRPKVVNLSMAISGSCALAVGPLFGASLWALAPVVLVWGWFVVADSAQFSALVTEAAPSHAVGTALTLQTSLGFLLTLVTLQGVPLLAQAWGWAWAFPVLSLGPALGILAIRAFTRHTAAAG